MPTIIEPKSAASKGVARILRLLESHSARAWAVCWIAILFAGLFPFVPVRHNDVQWLRNENGLRFGPNGVALGTSSVSEFLSDGRTDGFTLEILFRPHSEKKTLGSILAEDSDRNDPGFVIEQWGRLLLLRTFFTDSGHSTYRKIGVEALTKNREVHVAITSGQGRTVLFVNGKPEESVPFPIAVNKLTGKFLLGNSGVLTTPWSGDVFMLSIFSGIRSEDEIRRDCLAWRFYLPNASRARVFLDFHERSGAVARSLGSEKLSFAVPNHLRVFHPRYLRWDYRPELSGVSDVAINIVGFIPFGIFGLLVFDHRLNSRAGAAIVVLVLGALVSLVIEGLQSHIPLRSSSSTDWLMNTVGTFIGTVTPLILNRGKRIESTNQSC